MNTKLPLALCAALALGSLSAARTLNDYVLENQKTKLTFSDDATYGVRLVSIETKLATPNAGQPFSTEPSADGMMWVVRGTLKSGPSYETRPNNAGVTKTLLANNSLVLTWPSVPIQDAPVGEAPLQVKVRITLPDQEELALWECEVRRDGGLKRASIDTVCCPRIQFKLPVTHTVMSPTGEPESLLDAQTRARLFIPHAIRAYNLTANWPLRLAFASSPIPGAPLNYLADHPNSGQLLQMTSLYIADPEDPGYREMAFAAAEDTTGHAKRFLYKAETGSTPYFLWEHQYIPSFTDHTGANTEWGNELFGSGDALSPYPVAVGCLVAQGDAYWYDALAYYRTIAESLGITGPAREENSVVNPDFKGPAVLAAYGYDRPLGSSYVPGAEYDFLDMTRAYRDFFRRNGQADPTFMQLHFYLRAQGRCVPTPDGGVLYPSSPTPQKPPGQEEETTIDPDAKNVIAAAWGEPSGAPYHIRSLVYTEGLATRESGLYSYWAFPAAAKLKRRDGSFASSSNTIDCGGTATPSLDTQVDFGTLSGQTWFSSPGGIGYEVVHYLDAFGLYVDGVSGTGFHIGYKRPESHPGHGGDYGTQGRKLYLNNVRAMIEQASPDGSAFVTSEAAKEFLGEELDSVQPGYDGLPGSADLGEEEIIRLYDPATADLIRDHTYEVPREARRWYVPTWHAVYHQYTPTSGLPMVITSIGMADLDGAGPSTPIPGQDWQDVICHAYASFFVTGSKPALLPYFYEQGDPHSPIRWDAQSQSAVQQTLTEDPQGYTYGALQFVRTLHESLAPSFVGNYNLYGRFQRPLAIDDVATVVNPTTSVWAHVKPAALFPELLRLLPLHQTQGIGAIAAVLNESIADYEVPVVRHSVWKYGDKIGAVLVNWTGSYGQLRATFDPSLYDVPPTAYTATIRDANGVLASAQQSAGAPVSINCSGTPLAGTLQSPTAVPPHSVWLIEFDFSG